MVFANYKFSHITAFFSAAIIHVGIVAWSSMPSTPIVLNQQAIQVSFVAPSADIQKKISTSKSKPKIQLAENENALQKKAETKNEEIKNPEKEEMIAGKQTSGQVDKNATATRSAQTAPVFDAAYLNNPAPGYPRSAKKRGIQGKVLLDVVVTADGTAMQVVVSSSSGSSMLDKAALEAVQKWHFIPAHHKGRLVQANVIVPVEFKLI